MSQCASEKLNKDSFKPTKLNSPAILVSTRGPHQTGQRTSCPPTDPLQADQKPQIRHKKTVLFLPNFANVVSGF
ncbi:MAG: hypothetical protein CMP23_04385 [Rickettsiales bacterium]|nr:hypothetical protein [Rickettsiales bacterium]|tara:strand:- start:2331 stop:2552 length:222 start_codon:yes stop_codon:yes gene_type:complete